MKITTRSAIAFLVCSSAAAHAQMAVGYEWKREHRCSNKSPAIAVSSVPAGAKVLQIQLIDNDMISWNHGGGTVQLVSTGNVQVPEGALGGYNGPCPPNFSSFGHDYQFVVKAIGQSGEVLETANATRTFSAAKVPN